MTPRSPLSVARRLRAALLKAGIFSLLLVIFPLTESYAQAIDFNDSVQNATLTLVGSAQIRPTGGVDQGAPGDDSYASITDNVNGERGMIVFPDPTGGQPISGFTFRVDIRSGGGTTSPADGFSLNLVRPTDPLLNPIDGNGYSGPPPPDGGSNLPEEGSVTGLGIGLDEYLNGSGDVIGFSVRVDGVLLPQIPAGTPHGAVDDATSLQTGPLGPLGEGDASLLGWATFEAVLTPARNLTLTWKGVEIFNGPVEWFPSAAQIVFGGRTGGLNAIHHIDNVFLELTSADIAVVSDIRSKRDFIEFDITDSASSVLNPATISVMAGGADVTAGLVISKTGTITTIRHDQAPPFPFATPIAYSIVADDQNGNPIERSGSFTIQLPAFPFGEDLLGAEDKAVDEMWGVRYIFNTNGGADANSQIDNLAEAMELIKGANDPDNFSGTVVDVSEPAMNHGDATARVIAPNMPYHSDAVALGCCTDDFIMYGVAYMKIVEAGDYTIGVHSDDGMGFRVQGWEFASINGAGVIDPGSNDSVIHPANTGDSNTRAIASDVQPGTYRIEFFWWERGGGDNGEIYIAKGAFVNDADTSEWLAIGTTLPSGTFAIPGFDATGVAVSSLGPALMEDASGMGLADFDQVFNPNGGDEAGLTNVTETEAVFGNQDLTPVVTIHDFVNFNDPQSGGPGRIPGDIPFAINTGADDNDFGVRFTGTLVVPIDATYNIGFQGDDGGYLRIPGQVFTSLSENATGVSAIDEAGARIICDCLSGNSSTTGQISLAAGSYPMEGLFFERGGGAYFEVFGAEVGATVGLIVANGAQTVQRPDRGVGLVAGPGVAGIRILSITHDEVTDMITLVWTSKEDRTYRILHDTDFGATFSDDIDDSYPGDAGSDSTTHTFSNPRPGEPRIFFKIFENPPTPGN